MAIIKYSHIIIQKSVRGYLIRKKQNKFLDILFSKVKWSDIEALFIELGAKTQEREGSRVSVILFGEVKVFHRPHPTPDTDKGAVASVRKWLESHGVKP